MRARTCPDRGVLDGTVAQHALNRRTDVGQVAVHGDEGKHVGALFREEAVAFLRSFASGRLSVALYLRREEKGQHREQVDLLRGDAPGLGVSPAQGPKERPVGELDRNSNVRADVREGQRLRAVGEPGVRPNVLDEQRFRLDRAGDHPSVRVLRRKDGARRHAAATGLVERGDHERLAGAPLDARDPRGPHAEQLSNGAKDRVRGVGRRPVAEPHKTGDNGMRWKRLPLIVPTDCLGQSPSSPISPSRRS